VCQPNGRVRFLMAPALLVFHDAGDLEISLACRSTDGQTRYLNELSIHHVGRQPAAGAPGLCRWQIDLNLPPGGIIRFVASRCTRTLTAPAQLTDEQRFAAEGRPPFSLP